MEITKMNVENSGRIDYDQHKLKVFASYIRPHKKAFAIDMLLSVMIALIDIIFPYISR